MRVSIITGKQQFGTVDLGTGAFQQIRSEAGEEYRGLIPTSNRSLLTLGFDGNLTSINPATGLTTVIGPTGLSDCSAPASPVRTKLGGRPCGIGRNPLCNRFQSKPLYCQPSDWCRKADWTYRYSARSISFALHFESRRNSERYVSDSIRCQREPVCDLRYEQA
jgi:hypothetical protein